MSIRSRFNLVMAVPVLMLAASGSTQGQSKTDFDSAALFRSSCAPCHGLLGNGDGPVASALTTKIKPLSGLTARHGGAFPADYVYQVIDGRAAVDAHGTRSMPVWGTYYGLLHQQVGSGADTDASEAATRLKINALIDYIKTLQTK